MKFNVAWAKVIAQNSVLKFVILCLSLTSLFFGLSSLKLALKDPIVIDRACFSKGANISDGKRTPTEIEFFLKEALQQRFDSVVQPRDGFLSSDELLLREKEQKDLESKKLIQRVVLNSVQLDGKAIQVETDRIISVGDLRSAFKFPLKVTIETVTRTEGNPYGIVLKEVKPVGKESK